MTFTRRRTSAIAGTAAAAAAALVLAGCGGSSGNGSTGSSSGGSNKLLGSGSTFQEPMEDAWIADYGQAQGAQITYNAVGSGQGITDFGSGTTNFAGSDVTMASDEQTQANKRCNSAAIHIPITAGGVGVTYNLSGVKDLSLSPDAIADIFMGKAKYWDDAAIKQDNPGVSLPHTAIQVFTRSDDSGTTAVFSSFLAATAPSIFTLTPDKHVDWPVGTGKPASAGVAGAVKQANGGITYVEEAYAEQQSLPTAKVENGANKFVALSPAGVSAALASAKVSPNGPNDLTMTIDYKPTNPAAYPISTVSYVIVCTKYSSSTDVSLLKGYLNYAATTGQSKATSLGFAPLPSALVTQVKKSIAAVS